MIEKLTKQDFYRHWAELERSEDPSGSLAACTRLLHPWLRRAVCAMQAAELAAEKHITTDVHIAQAGAFLTEMSEARLLASKTLKETQLESGEFEK